MSPTSQAPTSELSRCSSAEKHPPSSTTTAALSVPTRRESFRTPRPAAISSDRYLHYLGDASLHTLEDYDNTSGHLTGNPQSVASEPLSPRTRAMLRSTTEMGMAHTSSIPGEHATAPITVVPEYEVHLGGCVGGAEQLVPSRAPARICIVEPLPCRPPTSMEPNVPSKRARRDSVVSPGCSGNKLRVSRSHRYPHYMLEDRPGPLVEKSKARGFKGIARRWGRWLKSFGTHQGKTLQKHLE